MSPLARAMLRDLWHLRGQVATAALVVACGLAAFVTMGSAYASLVDARERYYAEYRFAEVFATLKRAPESASAGLRRIPGVRDLETRVVARVTLDVPGLQEPAAGRLVGIPDSGAPRLNALFLREGREPQPGRDDEVLASAAFADANGLRVGDRIGAVLGGAWKPLRIVGIALSPEFVYEVGPGMLFPDNRRFGVLWMRRDGLAAAVGMDGAFDDVVLSLDRGANERDVIDQVDRVLARYGGLGAYGRSEQVSQRILEDELGEIRIWGTWIPAIFLGIAAFLIYTLLARLVALQRGQVALLKAFGYSNSRVAWHFLGYAAATVCLGLLGGIVFGAWLGRALMGVYAQYFHFPALTFVLPPLLLAVTGGLTAAAATAGALGASLRAARLPPAEAMRPEAPATFRHSWLDRIAGRAGPALRMILRNVSRRPWRATLSVAGIAAAVATLVVGRFGFDTVTALMASQFGFAQRGDVTVFLEEPGPQSVVHELARLPGVLRSEAFRAAPVRLRSGHREKRVTLLGLPPDADLWQLIDAESRRVGIPREGVVLTRKLGEILGVGPGDPVRIEVLEGSRLQVDTRVAALSDEPIGLSAYMDPAALSRLLREGASVSGANLLVDRAKAPELFRALKRMPAVAAVTSRDAMLASVAETLERSFGLTTTVMAAFAAVLVVGVIYNSARIALSERGHELASLRVLGFSRAEIALLLLGEQALLTLVALPIGIAFGVALCALLIPVFDREMFRLPLALSDRTFALAALTVLAAAAASGALVWGRIARLDLIAVLKTRE